jgi:hypothetical protein
MLFQNHTSLSFVKGFPPTFLLISSSQPHQLTQQTPLLLCIILQKKAILGRGGDPEEKQNTSFAKVDRTHAMLFESLDQIANP